MNEDISSWLNTLEIDESSCTEAAAAVAAHTLSSSASGGGDGGGDFSPTLRKVMSSSVDKLSKVLLLMKATSSNEWVSNPSSFDEYYICMHGQIMWAYAKIINIK